MLGIIKKLWEKYDGRILFVVGVIVGWATKGILIWVKDWVMGKALFRVLFGWLFH